MKVIKQKYGPEFPEDYRGVSASEIQKDIARMVEQWGIRNSFAIFSDSPLDDDSWKTEKKNNRFI